MRDRRARMPGGIYFFTLTLSDRTQTLLTDHIEPLRRSIRQVRASHPFDILAMVVLPDHLHCIWQLPEDDQDYPTRWALIKPGFSRQIETGERISLSRHIKRERGIWQRRYWEHCIHDENDLQRHIDYIHFNPVKHGYAQRPVDWPYSSIHRYVRQGLLPPDWGGAP
ncbi:MAG: REP-associated tyrosine transposase [Pseudomonas sp.]